MAPRCQVVRPLALCPVLRCEDRLELVNDLLRPVELLVDDRGHAVVRSTLPLSSCETKHGAADEINCA